jgi:hypothetical protein
MKTSNLVKAASLRVAFFLTLAPIGIPPASAQVFIEGNSLSDRWFATDTDPTNCQFVVDFPITHPGTLQNILVWGQTNGTSSGIGEGFDAYVLRPAGDTTFLVMTNTGYLMVTNVGLNTYAAPPFNLQVGDLIAHYGRGIPLDIGTGGPSSVYDKGDGQPLPKPVVGEIISLPGPDYPLYNDNGRNYAMAISVSGVPNLITTQSGDGVIVSWPANGANTLLQTADLAGGIWTTNASFTSTTGVNSITNSSLTGTLFFRLRSP